MSVEVLLARIEPTGRNLPAHAWLCLTEEDRARAERFQRASDRVRFVAARFLLRAALRRRFGASDATLISPPGAKPSACGTGLPANLDVNLSHAGTLIACVRGTGVSVGIDVEPADRVLDAAEIARMERAATIADAALYEVLFTMSDGVTEEQFALALDTAMPRCA